MKKGISTFKNVLIPFFLDVDSVKDRPMLSRREFLMAGGASVAGMVCAGDLLAEEAKPDFEQRGYYITFMRMPTFGLEVWKKAVDCFASDEINLLILWMAGGFASKKFPITWKYNEDHENVRTNFAGELIDYAHQKARICGRKRRMDQRRTSLGFIAGDGICVRRRPIRSGSCWSMRRRCFLIFIRARMGC